MYVFLSMTDFPTDIASLPAQMGARGQIVDGRFDCWVESTPELSSHGVVRASVVAMMVDMAAGYAAQSQADEDWTFTADLSVRQSPRPVKRLSSTINVLRRGRSITVDMPITDDAGRPGAHGVSTFTRLTRRDQDPPRQEFKPVMGLNWPSATAPLDELMAATVIDDKTLALPLEPRVMNPALVLQGAVAALLIELSAQRVVERAFGESMVAVGLDLRYLTMGRVGPFHATAELLDGRPVATVKLMDTGRPDPLNPDAPGVVVVHCLADFAHPMK